MAEQNPRKRRSKKRVRYAVVGAGHITQNAVLPAFANAKKNSELATIVSGDEKKRKELAEMYGLERTYSYEQYDECLHSGGIDAVYIALPNDQHAEYSVRAARAGVHVLCEKPMAVTEEECQQMIDAARQREVKLMIAYRLHFEKSNLDAIELIKAGKLGQEKLFNSVFNMQVDEDNIRLDRDHGGGPLYDIGIYCINAARYLFQADPLEVTSFAGNTGDPRFTDVDEAEACVLRFPGDRLATFVCSFGAADVGTWQVVGTEGDLRAESAFSYQSKIKHFLTIGGKTTQTTYKQRDHFAPELLYFSECILQDKEPEPSGLEGLADVRVIQALLRSAKTRQTAKIEPLPPKPRPSAQQEIYRPAVSPPELVHADSPHED